MVSLKVGSEAKEAYAATKRKISAMNGSRNTGLSDDKEQGETEREALLISSFSELVSSSKGATNTSTRRPCLSRALRLVQCAMLLVVLSVIAFMAYTHAQGSGSIVTDTTQKRHRNMTHLNDATLNMDRNVSHLWLQDNAQNRPKLRLVLTDFGWNHPDKRKGLTYYRSKRSRELVQAFVNHPYFDSSFAWNSTVDINEDEDVQTIVLLDFETCFIGNYPYYTGTQRSANADLDGGRVYKEPGECICWLWDGHCAPFIQQVLNSPLFQSQTTDQHATLLFLECSGDFSWKERFPVSLRHSHQPSQQLSVVSMSATWQQLRDDSDMGMPPPAINPVELTEKERFEIQSCATEQNRQFFISFIGAERSPWDHGVRKGLFGLNNSRDILLMETHDFEFKYQGKHTFDSVTRSSQFAATPRGDCLFSYRFTEVLSAGAIPVLYADGWVLPFRHELIDWNHCAVVIPEADVNHTVEILKAISKEKRCQMRQKCYQIFQTYFAKPEGTIKGIVDSVVAMKNAVRG